MLIEWFSCVKKFGKMLINANKCRIFIDEQRIRPFFLNQNTDLKRALHAFSVLRGFLLVVLGNKVKQSVGVVSDDPIHSDSY